MPALSDELMKTAETLLGGVQPGSAARRRAASTAYYALFHRLSALCANRLMGPYDATPLHWRAYRALEHKQVKEALARSDEFKAQFGASFSELQDIRHWADYSVSSHPEDDKAKARKKFGANDARDCLRTAKEAISFIDNLDGAARRRLATLLIVRDRR